MKSRWISLIVFLSFTTLLFFLAPKSLPNLQGSSAWGEEETLPFPKDPGFTTLITTRRGIEGLTGDNHRNLYTGGSGTSPCPVWQINLNNPVLTVVGSVVSTQPPPPAMPACNLAVLRSMRRAIFTSLMATRQPFIFSTPVRRIRPSPRSTPQGYPAPTDWHLTDTVTFGQLTEPRA